MKEGQDKSHGCKRKWTSNSFGLEPAGVDEDPCRPSVGGYKDEP